MPSTMLAACTPQAYATLMLPFSTSPYAWRVRRTAMRGFNRERQRDTESGLVQECKLKASKKPYPACCITGNAVWNLGGLDGLRPKPASLIATHRSRVGGREMKEGGKAWGQRHGRGTY